MTIDIEELRRLAQAETPGPWVAAGPSFGESLPKYLNEVAVDREGDEDDGYSICNAPIGLNEECSDDMAFIAEANPLTIEELLDRLEAAEKEREELRAAARGDPGAGGRAAQDAPAAAVTMQQAAAWSRFQKAMGNDAYCVEYASVGEIADAVIDLIVTEAGK